MVAASQAAAPDKAALLRQADQYMGQGKFNLARARYEEAIRAGADLSNDYQRSRDLGLCYMNGTPRDYAKAAQWLETAWKLRPKDEDTRLAFAQSLAWGGNYPPAIEHYQALSAAHPDSADYVLGLANAYQWSGQAESAQAALQSYLEIHPSNTNVRLEYARLLSFSRKFAEASSQYQVILQGDPSDVHAQVGMAKIASWQGDLQTALEGFNAILKHHPDLYDAIVGKAFTLYWMDKPNEARPLFQAALRRNPGDKEVKDALKAIGPEPPKPKPPEVVAQARPAETRVETVPAPAEAAPAPAPAPAVAQVPAKPVEENPVPALLAAGEAAAARGDYTAAVHNYHKALEREPANEKAKLQIARVLSWSKNYADSITEYAELLRTSPGNQQARLEKARVLSWSNNFEASIAEYKRVLADAEAAQKATPAQPPIAIGEARLELARVLSWAQHYDESLAQLALLLPEGQKPVATDKPVLVQKARVLSYARRYDDSTKAYDQALVLDPGDFEAKLGKAQTIYYSGRLDDAAVLLRALLDQQPKQPEASFTLAAVEHGLGRNGRALNLLNYAPKDQETAKLRNVIREDLRPVLRLRFGYENDIEEPSAVIPNVTTIRALRYTAGLEFSVHPDVRMEVVNTVTQGNTSNPLLLKHGEDFIATETMARLNFRISPWLRMIAGAGVGTTGRGCLVPSSIASCIPSGQADRQQYFIYEIHPIVTRGAFRLDITATRHIADYTPLAVHDNVVHWRESIAPSYTWRRRLRLGAEYWHSNYTLDSPDIALGPLHRFDTSANGGSAYVTPILYQSDRLTVDAGMRYEHFAFSDDTTVINANLGSGGFFAPRAYQRYAGTGHIAWDPHPNVHLDLSGTFGPQRVFTFDTLGADWGTTGSAGTQLTFNLGRWHPYVAYDFFTTATAASPGLIGATKGNYGSHSVVVGLIYRF